MSTITAAGVQSREKREPLQGRDAQHVVAPHSLGPARARGHRQVHKVVRPQVRQPRGPVAQRSRVAKRGRAVERRAKCGQGQQHDRRDQLHAVDADVEVLRAVVLLMQVLACGTPPRRQRACLTYLDRGASARDARWWTRSRRAQGPTEPRPLRVEELGVDSPFLRQPNADSATGHCSTHAVRAVESGEAAFRLGLQATELPLSHAALTRDVCPAQRSLVQPVSEIGALMCCDKQNPAACK